MIFGPYYCLFRNSEEGERGLEFSMKYMRQGVGVSTMVKNNAEGGDTGVATSRGVNSYSRLVCIEKGKMMYIGAGHYRKLRVESENAAVVGKLFKVEVDSWAQGKEETSRTKSWECRAPGEVH